MIIAPIIGPAEDFCPGGRKVYYHSSRTNDSPARLLVPKGRGKHRTNLLNRPGIVTENERQIIFLIRSVQVCAPEIQCAQDKDHNNDNRADNRTDG